MRCVIFNYGKSITSGLSRISFGVRAVGYPYDLWGNKFKSIKDHIILTTLDFHILHMGKLVGDTYKLEAIKRNPVVRDGFKGSEVHPPEGHHVVLKNNVRFITNEHWEPKEKEIIEKPDPITEHQKTYYKIVDDPTDFMDVRVKLDKKTSQVKDPELQEKIISEMDFKDLEQLEKEDEEQKKHDLEKGGIEVESDALDINNILGTAIEEPVEEGDKVVDDISDLFELDEEEPVVEEKPKEEPEEEPKKKPAKKAAKKPTKKPVKKKTKKTKGK